MNRLAITTALALALSAGACSVSPEDSYVANVAEASMAAHVCGMQADWDKIREDGAKVGVKAEDLAPNGKYDLQRLSKQTADIVNYAGTAEWCDLRDHYLGPCGETRPGWLTGNGKECAFVRGLAEKRRQIDAAAATAAKDAQDAMRKQGGR